MITEDIISKLYGVKTYTITNPANTALTTSSQQVAPADPGCLSLVFVNLGSVDAIIAPNNAPSTTNGVIVPANGGLVAYNFKDDLLLPTYEWFGIGNGGNTTIFVIKVGILQ